MNIDKISIELTPRLAVTRKITSNEQVSQLLNSSRNIIKINGVEIKNSVSVHKMLDKLNHNENVEFDEVITIKPPETFMIVRKSLFRFGKKTESDTNFDGFTSSPNNTFFVGSFKVGKTKISRDVIKLLDPTINLIEDSLNNINESNPVINTTGEVLFELSQGKLNEVIIDTEGLNQVIKTKHSMFIKQFIVEHSIKFASMIFYVIEKFTPEELNGIFLFMNLLRTHNTDCRFVLIHNIRSIKKRSDLNTYVTMYFKNYANLFKIDENDTKADVVSELFSSTKIGQKFNFEEVFCCSSEDESYGKMIKRIADLIKNQQRRPKGTLQYSVCQTINKILSTQSQFKTDDLLKDFNISFTIDVEKAQYNPASVSINERHRKAICHDQDSVILVYEYIISVPESTRIKEEIKITLEEVTIQIEIKIYDYFSKTKRPENFKLFEGLIISTNDSTLFTNKSITILENCAFRFLVKINEPYDPRYFNLPLVS